MGFVARAAAVTQLLSVFRWRGGMRIRSAGAWLAMLVTAFSLYHVKFLLFDTFRPDHLAYPLILLQIYLAMTGRFWPLWVVTLISCQIREFNALPLVAFSTASVWAVARRLKQHDRRRAVYQHALISAVGLGDLPWCYRGSLSP